MTRAERLKAAHDERQEHLMAADEKLSASAEGTMTDDDRKAVQDSLDAADKCTNYCDAALATTHPSGVCTNGGVCKSENGDPDDKGTHSCTCPSSWMY